MTGLGKPLIICGIILIVFGVIISFAGKIPWLGRLPGDILIKRDNFTFYFPLATCILVSVLVSLLFWLLKR
jgi:hypothetical protein